MVTIEHHTRASLKTQGHSSDIIPKCYCSPGFSLKAYVMLWPHTLISQIGELRLKADSESESKFKKMFLCQG